MLEDSNTLVLIESLKILELLAKLHDFNLKGKYARKYTRILFDKFKETKKAVYETIKNALDALIENEIISIENMVEIALTLDPHKSIKTKKVIVSTSSVNGGNPRTKKVRICFIIFRLLLNI